MFTTITPTKDAFLNQARTAREQRQNAKSQNDASVKIQKYVRGWLCRKKYKQHIRYFECPVCVETLCSLVLFTCLLDHGLTQCFRNQVVLFQ